MLKNVLIVLLAGVAVGTSIWGYNEHQKKEAILINAENTYQRAFHDLSYQMDILHDKIGNTLAMNSGSTISPQLTDVWRVTSEAQTDVGQLPLALLPFSKTEEFLSDIGDFSYKTAVRDLDKEPLDEKEYSRLQKLYTQAGEVQADLRKVQYQVMKNNLRWMDVETALASRKEPGDNTIIDGFKTVEKKVAGYAEKAESDPENVSAKEQNQTFRNLKGKEISKDEAAKTAKKYAGFSNAKVKVESNRKGAEYEFYSVTLTDRATNAQADMDLTKKGGIPIWLINNREVKSTKITLNEAGKKAAKFLKDHDFSSLEMYESSEYDHMGLFHFVTEIDGVRIYPDAVKVKVALDDGSVIGFSADEYLKSHNVDRTIRTPKLTSEEAKEKISKKVKIMEEYRALILNNAGEETLCYEYLGTINEDTFRIFINADTGKEEKVEKLKNPEPVYENIV